MTKVTCEVSAPSYGLAEGVTMNVPDASSYSAEDVATFANRTIAIAAQAAARGAVETAYKKALKAAMDKSGAKVASDAMKADATKAGRAALAAFIRDKAPTFMIERRDEEAAATKKVEKAADAFASLSPEAQAEMLKRLTAIAKGQGKGA